MTQYTNKKSKISLFFLIVFCAFALFGTSLWIALKHGIELDQLNFSPVKMELEISAELISLKDFSKIINKIPLAGYALLGEDGSINTSLLIPGSLTKPKIETHLSQEIVMTPINVVKRTIKWPLKIFDKPEDGENKKPEPEK